MTKNEAQKEAQRLLAEASKLVDAAERLMDEHRFSIAFFGKNYCPNNLTTEEVEEGDLPIGSYLSEGDGGVWQSSSDMC